MNEMQALTYNERLELALHELVKRKLRAAFAKGGYIAQDVWMPAADEIQDCCKSLLNMRIYFQKLYQLHASTAYHVAKLYRVKRSDLTKLYRDYLDAQHLLRSEEC